MYFRNRVDHTVSLMFALSFMVVGTGGDAIGKEPATSVYSEVAGAGGLRFEGVDDLDLMYLVEVRDFNNDGAEDLLFGFGDNGDYGAGYALGEVGEDGTINFTIQYLVPASNYDALTAGDLDGDGFPEICTRRDGSTSVLIYWMPEDGLWSDDFVSLPFTDYSAGDVGFHDARVGLESGDLDGDGLADFVLNSSESRVVVRWSSRPEGTEWQVYPVPQLGEANALYGVRDYDGDGVRDVLLLDTASEEFVLLKGTGFDLVMLPELIEIPVAGFVERGDMPFFGNFDGNGAVDLVLNNSDDGTSVVVTDFVTNESEAVALTLDDGERVVGVPGDLDGSGVDELLVVGVDADSHATRIIDEPSLVFDALTEGTSQVVIEVGNVPVFGDLDLPRIPLCAGVNFDGVGGEDLLWMGRMQGFSISNLNIPTDTQTWTGGSTLRVSSWRDVAGIPIYGASQFEGQNVPAYMLPVDVDQDGIDELIVVGNASRAKLVDVNDGVTVNISGVNNAFMCAMADLGGDGEPEAVFSRVFNSLAVLRVNSDGTFEPRILFANPNGNEYLTLLVEDFDADGKDDVLLFDQSNNEYHIWRGTGDASAELWTVTDTIPGGSTKSASIDLDQDNLPDLVTGTDGTIRLYSNNGDGTFAEANSFPVPFAPYWIETRDMDLDGFEDIVCVSRTGPTMIFFMGADHNRQLVVELFRDFQVDEVEIIIDDFNNDGLQDLLASAQAGNLTANEHTVWLQSSERVFVPAGELPASESSTIASSDFNGDGAVDIATASNWDDSVRVHWGTPDACAADLTGDGALNFLDISEFLSSQLDFDGDGSFNFLDISAYLLAYGAGCP